MNRDSQSGHVAIVGAGPGDPGLITVAGMRALEGADVVLYDALASPELLRYAGPGAQLTYVGKRAGAHAMSQEQINECLVARAQTGKRVVRLKGGDPFVFGRGSEEALACRAANVPFTVIPGITSAIAAPAYAGIPVTHRGVSTSFMVVTGSEARDDGSGIDWPAASKAGTLLILMGASRLEEVMERLMAAGKAPGTPVACVRWGTRADQEVVPGTVATIAEAVRTARLGPPIVTVVDGVAALRDELTWFEPGPLAGKRIVVTRARAQASGLAEGLSALGAQVVEAPVIGVETHGERLPLADGITWDWLIFTSANGVEAFFEALRGIGKDPRALATARVASIGQATSEALGRVGIVPDFVPSRATSGVLVAEIEAVDGSRILLPVSSRTDERLAGALRTRGGIVEQIAAYDTVAEPLDEQRLRDVAEAHAITFTSASTAQNLRDALGNTNLSPETKLVSIGPETSRSVREAFGRLDGEAETPSLDSLVAAVREVLALAPAPALPASRERRSTPLGEGN